MLLKIFSIYDTKAEAYNQPFFMTTIGQATRAFADEANNPNSNLSKHPEDYTLFEIGVFDDEDASVSMLVAPKSLGTALEHVSRGQA